MPLKQCSKCKISFECSCEKEGCWCEGIYIDIDTLNKLKTEFDNCLCKNCLKEYARNKTP